MCIWVECNDQFCTDQGDLIAALGGAELVMDAGIVSDPQDCLCSVDLPETAAKHGYTMAPGWKADCCCDWKMTRWQQR